MTEHPDEELDGDILGNMEALADFETTMNQVVKDYADAQTISDRRGAVVGALTAVYKMMAEIGMQRVAGPIFEVAVALCAVDRGGVLPLFRVDERPAHGPKTAEGIWIQRAVVAAALEQRFRTTRAGLTPAAAEIARWLNGSVILSGVTNGKTAVVKWREDVSGRMSTDLARKVYDHYCRRAEASSGLYVCPLGTAAELRLELQIWGSAGNPKDPPLNGGGR